MAPRCASLIEGCRAQAIDREGVHGPVTGASGDAPLLHTGRNSAQQDATGRNASPRDARSYAGLGHPIRALPRWTSRFQIPTPANTQNSALQSRAVMSPLRDGESVWHSDTPPHTDKTARPKKLEGKSPRLRSRGAGTSPRGVPRPIAAAGASCNQSTKRLKGFLVHQPFGTAALLSQGDPPIHTKSRTATSAFPRLRALFGSAILQLGCGTQPAPVAHDDLAGVDFGVECPMLYPQGEHCAAAGQTCSYPGDCGSGVSCSCVAHLGSAAWQCVANNACGGAG